jgi:hypothetical protein
MAPGKTVTTGEIRQINTNAFGALLQHSGEGHVLILMVM